MPRRQSTLITQVRGAGRLLEPHRVMIPGLTLLADAAAQRSAPQRAAQLFGCTDAIIERTGASLFPIFDELAERGQTIQPSNSDPTSET